MAGPKGVPVKGHDKKPFTKANAREMQAKGAIAKKKKNEILNGAEAAWAIETGWRYMFGSEMIPAGLFALLICFVPETPRYLAMVGLPSGPTKSLI